MQILIGCEKSGVVRRAFRAAGHMAYSCDTEPSDDNSPFHIQGDLLDIIHDWNWDMMIAHPPCTYLSCSGLHWNKKRPEREQLTKEAAMFFIQCWEAPIPRIVIENPIGCMSRIVGKPEQIIQPYQFGEDASKATCLWLRNVPKLSIHPLMRKDGRMVEWPVGSGKMRERWGNQTDSGQNRLGPSPERAYNRAKTYPLIAIAMAEQWGKLPV